MSKYSSFWSWLRIIRDIKLQIALLTLNLLFVGLGLFLLAHRAFDQDSRALSNSLLPGEIPNRTVFNSKPILSTEISNLSRDGLDNSLWNEEILRNKTEFLVFNQTSDFFKKGINSEKKSEGKSVAVSRIDSLHPYIATKPILLIAEGIFDGKTAEIHAKWGILIQGKTITQIGALSELKLPASYDRIDLGNTTLMPGLIDAHTHVLLHPYNETTWNDQVAREPQALRVCRATNHLRLLLESGFTTIRDLGTEGAGYADVGLRDAIKGGIIPGPRMLVVTKAIVATGTYGPKGFAPEWTVPQGAEEGDGVANLIRITRDQIGRGADWIKVYADAAMAKGPSRPTFSVEELKAIVQTANSLGVSVAAHAISIEGMKRAILAGVRTIEHGYEGDIAIFRLAASEEIFFCPTLATVEAYARYQGWNNQNEGEPKSVQSARKMIAIAIESGVAIANGSDIGVFPHGEGVRELELLVDYGLKPFQAIQSATTVAANALHLDKQIGKLQPGFIADIIAVSGNPLQNIRSLRNIKMVMKEGIIYRK